MYIQIYRNFVKMFHKCYITVVKNKHWAFKKNDILDFIDLEILKLAANILKSVFKF